ncbi:MAG TPA: thiolase family protein [Ramlibacter sp.]|uniref:thiolase family protein n=1 Tax=Ramlibacter sp. TaxID=1917967 RepID=UPI002CF8A2D3|nr:thiolase family protein [Ramlibacter sp.]HVZ44926.1 thiolase family protein [Ramlibacter sp.]
MSKRRAGAAVIGVGHTRFGNLPEHSPYDLGIWALKEALSDAVLALSEVDGLIVNRIPDYQRLCEMLDFNPRFVSTTPGQGRFSGNCIEQAVAVLQAGLAKTVALVYGNNGRSGGDRYGGGSDVYGSGGAGLWFPYGMTSPGAFHAMMFQRHMHEFGTTPDDLGRVATTLRSHALLNPAAVMRKPMTMDDYREARFIAEPLRLLDYCLINDGGVAMILTLADRAAAGANKPVYVSGFAQASQFGGSTFPPEDYWRAPMQAAAADVYANAGRSRDEMDALMIYDNFTPVVLFALEGFGFCPPGESGRFVADGHLALGGRFPANTSGGHLSESYMQGWALNVEAVRQIRGQCGARQAGTVDNVQYICCSPLITSIIYSSSPE